MKLYVGSLNPVKVDAVREIIQDYFFLKGAEIIACETESGVSKQPLSFEETVRGAMNRARSIHQQNSYAIGLESGLIDVPLCSRKMDLCVCSIYDGKKYAYGISSGFELPTAINNYLTTGKFDLNDASFGIGITSNEKVGSSEGLIGILTRNRVTRKDYTKQALQMALIQLDFPEMY